MFSESIPMNVEPLNSVPMEMDGENTVAEDNRFYQPDARQKITQKGSLVSRIRSNSAYRNYHVQSNSLPKSSTQYSGGKYKLHVRKEVNVKHIGERLSKEACDELLACEVCQHN